MSVCKTFEWMKKMQTRKLVAVVSLWQIDLRDPVRRFGTWWSNEFLNLFPEKVAKRLVRKARNVLILTVSQNAVTLDLQSYSRNLLGSEQIKPADYSPGAVDHFLQLHGLDLSEVDIAVGLPSESIFCRRLMLPLEASNAIDDIITQSLLKKTPFKPEDVYFDHVAIKANGGQKIEIRQWITRRKFVHASLSQLKIDLESVAFIVATGDAAGGAEPSPVIKLRAHAQARKPWQQKLMLTLACTAVVLSLVASGNRYWRQQIIIDDLQTRIATVRPKAQNVRGLVDKLREKQTALVRLRLHRSNAPGLIDLWEETTRILPSHTWLSELRLAETQDQRERQMVIIGFSAAAPSLVGIIDSSPLFLDAALTAPVSLDPVEKVERFALQAKVANQPRKTSQ